MAVGAPVAGGGGDGGGRDNDGKIWYICETYGEKGPYNALWIARHKRPCLAARQRKIEQEEERMAAQRAQCMIKQKMKDHKAAKAEAKAKKGTKASRGKAANPKRY